MSYNIFILLFYIIIRFDGTNSFIIDSITYKYDFSIIFDTVENRKARHQMERKYVPDMEIKYEKEADEK